MMHRLWREQNGLILPLALVVLGVGVMILTPFLGGISTTLISARHSQSNTGEQYAADSAYEDAVWNLTHGGLVEELTAPCDSTSYTLAELVNGIQPTITVTRPGQCVGGDDDDDHWGGDDDDDHGGGDDDGDHGASGEALTSITYQISITAGDTTTSRDAAVYFCAGMPATIMGTSDAETLTGTSNDDVIIGIGGNDNINGYEGADTICGGAGNDNINGGDGDDRVYGGEGSDQISGGSGDDLIKGESGFDLLNGDSGDDIINGGTGIDVCDGGLGSDSIFNCGDEDDEYEDDD